MDENQKTENDFRSNDSVFDERKSSEETINRKLIPISVSTVGRSIKLRDLFTLSGCIKTDVATVTVSADSSSGAITDLKSFKFFQDEFHPGLLIKITALGTITSDGTRTVKISLGSGLAAAHTEWNSMTSTAALITTQPWHLVWYGIVSTLGASGTLEGQMIGKINNVNKDDPNTATVAFNSTSSITIALTADWDGTDAGNSVVIRQWIVEIIN